MNKSESITDIVNNDDIEENVKIELDDIYHILSDKYNSQNKHGILSDIKSLIYKISLTQNEKD